MLSVVTLLSVLMLDATFLAAQTNRGGITGTIVDPHGAVIVMAKRLRVTPVDKSTSA